MGASDLTRKAWFTLAFVLIFSGCCSDDCCEDREHRRSQSDAELATAASAMSTKDLWKAYMWDATHSRPPHSRLTPFLLERPDAAQVIFSSISAEKQGKEFERERAVDFLIELMRRDRSVLSEDQQLISFNSCKLFYSARQSACAIFDAQGDRPK